MNNIAMEMIRTDMAVAKARLENWQNIKAALEPIMEQAARHIREIEGTMQELIALAEQIETTKNKETK